MSLECVYPSMGVLAQAEWFKIGTEKDSIAIYSPTHGVVIRKPYAEKVYFLNSAMASNNLTLFFRNASEDDVGYYSCSLYAYPEGSWQKVIQVVQSGLYPSDMVPFPSAEYSALTDVQGSSYSTEAKFTSESWLSVINTPHTFTTTALYPALKAAANRNMRNTFPLQNGCRWCVGASAAWALRPHV
ncbi:hypothetical protein P7K49_027982 [Saguinus oedipus]|uniref:Ig-like domain-containing protein n=1 Tax=Saguinus oedipus TaxID=9490 RepID=A0ABQ9UAZ7_SAGOE|nr:hypothetical protein P7K49_027982 [Saguinus oedipus]